MLVLAFLLLSSRILLTPEALSVLPYSRDTHTLLYSKRHTKLSHGILKDSDFHDDDQRQPIATDDMAIKHNQQIPHNRTSYSPFDCLSNGVNKY